MKTLHYLLVSTLFFFGLLNHSIANYPEKDLNLSNYPHSANSSKASYLEEELNPSNINTNSSLDTICPNECVELTVTDTFIHTTTDYLVNQIPYSPFPYISANEVPISNFDDVWSSPIDLPFDFCFYGNSYNQVTVGTNGLVSFNVSEYANQASGWQINSPIPGDINILNSIACPYQDLNFALQGDMYYDVYGTAPFRVIVFSFNDAGIYSCPDTINQQVALYESTNIIETNILNKPLCSWNGGSAIHGIQNADGTLATVVPGRNYPAQWAASDDSWRFSPNGPSATVSANWYDDENNIIGNGLNITVCPSETSNYIADITYENPIGANCDFSINLLDTFIITVSDTPIYPNITGNLLICEGECTTLNTGTFDNYLWSTGETTQSIEVCDAATYSVTVTNNSCTGEAETTATVSVSDVSILLLSTSSANCSSCDGTATIQTNGAGTFSYLWSNGNTSAEPSDLCAGINTVTVTDMLGCMEMLDVLIGDANTLDINIISITDVSGYGLADGEVIIEGTGGEAPYNYIWSNGETTPTISNLLAGTYSLSLTDTYGCFADTTITIVSPPLLELLIQNVEGDINGEGTGLIMIQVIGGVPPYTYSWEDADGNVISTDMNPSGLFSNLYRVFVTDANGNMAESDWIEVEMLVNIVNPTLSYLISLSPNPAQDEINLKIKDTNNDAQVIVIDVRGREVYRQKINEGNNRIDISPLTEGIYFFRVQVGRQSVVEKVLVSK